MKKQNENFEDNDKESKEAGRKAFLALCACGCREYEDQGN